MTQTDAELAAEVTSTPEEATEVIALIDTMRRTFRAFCDGPFSDRKAQMAAWQTYSAARDAVRPYNINPFHVQGMRTGH
jgi:hypothetical protein